MPSSATTTAPSRNSRTWKEPMPPLSSASPRTLAPGPPAPEPAPIQSQSNQQPVSKIGFVPEQVGQALPPANSAPGPAAPPAEDVQPPAPGPRPPI